MQMKKINTHIFSNLKYKITVFFLAVLVWFFVKTEDNYRYSTEVPLKIVNLSSERVITNEIPTEVTVTFWGKGRSLFSLAIQRDIIYVLDVAKVEDSAKIALDKNNILVLRKNDIEVLNVVNPKFVEVQVEPLLSKRVPVSSLCEIETIPGYVVIGDVVLDPDSVDVIAPEKTIKKIFSITTEKKIFKKVKSDLEEDVKLVLGEQPYVSIKQEKVFLKADVQKLMEKPFSEIPVELINYPSEDNVLVLPSTMSLVLEGGTDELLSVTKNDIKAYIDYTKIKYSHEKDHPAYIVTPAGTRYRDVKPTRFKIVVMK